MRRYTHDKHLSAGAVVGERKARCKADRVIDEYGLLSMDERLAARWLRRDGEAASLRELADFFNRDVLRAVMERNGVSPLDGEVENAYRLLTGDVRPSERTRLRTRLERDGATWTPS